MNLIKRIGKAFFAELHKPGSFVREEDFELYVRDIVFPSGKYQLVHRCHSHHDNKEDYIVSSLLPDFGFRCEETGKMFYVEVKFQQESFTNDKMEWLKPYQLERYRKLDKENHPIFLVLGLGGNLQKPEGIYIIPVSKVKFTHFHDGLDKYKVNGDKPILSSYLWNLR